MFKKLLKIIAIILVILAFIYLFAALLAFAGAFSAGVAVGTSWLGFGFLTFTSGWGLLIAAVASYTVAYLVDPKTARETADKIVAAGGDLIESGGELIGSAGSAIIKSVSPWLIAAAAAFIWWRTKSNRQEPQPPTQVANSKEEDHVHV